MDSAAEDQAAPAIEQKTFEDVVRSLIGKTVTVVNPESYEDAPVGHTLKAGFYRAKVSGAGRDYITVVTEYKKAGKGGGPEPVKQFVPLSRVKRLSVMKQELLIHL